MTTTTLGRTGLTVSVMGLGCGGHSRLGLATGGTTDNAIRVVRTALELGINFIDTAESYRTEPAVGAALKNTPRAAVLLSTKLGPHHNGALSTAAELIARAEGTLQRLQTDYVDILHLHGVAAADYAYCQAELVPALQTLQQQGKARFLGITEAFITDPGHVMLQRALGDPCWDVMMVGFNLLNPSARERVLTRTQAQGIGTLCMFAVRRALSQPDALAALLADLAQQGLIPPHTSLDGITNGVANSLTELAYRFCRHEPGIDVVLSGTGNPAHLRENALALSGPPLPAALQAHLAQLFGSIDSVSGN